MKKRSSITAIAIIGSMVAVHSAWAAEQTAPSTPQPTVPAIQPKTGQPAALAAPQENLNQLVQQAVEQARRAFPQLKDYKTLKVSTRKGVNEMVFATVSINGEGTRMANLVVNKKTGELRTVAFLEPITTDGEVRYTVSQGPEGDQPVTDETAQRLAAQLIDRLYGTDAKNAKQVSLWRDTRDGIALPPVVNFKAPVGPKGDTARYVSVQFGGNGQIYGFEAVTKPVSYDQWFAAALSARTMPNDPLSQPAQVTYDKLSALYPALSGFKLKQAKLDDYDQTFTIEFRSAAIQKDAEAIVKMDAATGALLRFELEKQKQQMGKGAEPEVAKEKAYAFLQAFYGEKVKAYHVDNQVMTGENGPTQVVLASSGADKAIFILYVGADGRICSMQKMN
ncbi:hypothetical protein ACTID9_06245 [Brevibacillus fluminis]|uniref:hypothetical protein n=1 Tax=Brevibacillus fluminis TaxID=511487 RepID=UPI003F88FE97